MKSDKMTCDLPISTWSIKISSTVILCVFITGSITASGMKRLEKLPDDFTEIRDPLLPSDFVRPGEQEAQEAQEAPDPEELRRQALLARIKWPKLELQGISHAGGKRFIAVIKEYGIVEEGDTVRILKDGLIYTWEIDEISQKGMKTTKLRVRESQEPKQQAENQQPQDESVPIENLEIDIETP